MIVRQPQFSPPACGRVDFVMRVGSVFSVDDAAVSGDHRSLSTVVGNVGWAC